MYEQMAGRASGMLGGGTSTPAAFDRAESALVAKSAHNGLTEGFEVLEKELLMLHEVTGLLEGRLSPVLVPEEPSSASGRQSENQRMCSPTASGLRHFAARVAEARVRLERINGRLDF